MRKYCLEFILNMQNATLETLKNSIIEFGEDLEIFQLPQDSAIKGREFKVRIHTEDPTIIFDTCAQFGRLKSIKVD
jgi:dihydroxyacetone kinase-like predicted kinase